MSVCAKLILYFYGFPVSRKSEAREDTDGRTGRQMDGLDGRGATLNELLRRVT